MMGMKTCNKPTDIKYKLYTGASADIMPLTTYHLVNPVEFNKQGKPIGRCYQHNLTKILQW